MCPHHAGCIYRVRRAHRLPEVPKARKIARLQGCPRSLGAILRAAVKVPGQYCGRCTQSVHYIYSPCMMWAHPLNVSPISLRRPYGRHAHRLWDVPKARNIARLQGCPRIPGAILRAAIKVLGQYCGRCTQPVHSIYSP